MDKKGLKLQIDSEPSMSHKIDGNSVYSYSKNCKRD